MTKPSEEFMRMYDKILRENGPRLDTAITIGFNEYVINIAWLAYLKGQSDRPVVVPGLKQFPHGKRFVCTCDFIVHNYVKPHKYCGNCGAKLDWSKVE